MSSIAAARTSAVRSAGGVRAEDFRTALQRTLTSVAADERIGPLIGATDLSMRFRFTDSELTLDVASEQDGHNLSWSFGGDASKRPRLELEMDTATANRFLQGRESLAIAIARGRVKVRGESRAALTYVPVTRLIREPYLRVIESDFPELAATGLTR